MPRVQSRPVQEQLPGEVLALAASEGLGELRASFLPKRAGVWAVIGMVFFSLLGLLVFVLPGLFFVWRLLQTPNFNSKQAAKRIHCFDHGLIVSDRDRPVAFRWDSASVLQQITRRYANGVYVGTSYLYTLFKPDGSTIELTGFYADPEVWGAAIQHEITRAQLPRALDLVGRGETVRFGDVAVNAHGMATAKRGSCRGARWSGSRSRTAWCSWGGPASCWPGPTPRCTESPTSSCSWPWSTGCVAEAVRDVGASTRLASLCISPE
ncbi:DUF6585 family protein [Streptomyces lavendulae]